MNYIHIAPSTKKFTAKGVKEILNNSKVVFTSNKNGFPAIFAYLHGEDKDPTWVATRVPDSYDLDLGERCGDLGWRGAFARVEGNRAPHESLFTYCTDAAVKLVDRWIIDLIRAYEDKLQSDTEVDVEVIVEINKK